MQNHQTEEIKVLLSGNAADKATFGKKLNMSYGEKLIQIDHYNFNIDFMSTRECYTEKYIKNANVIIIFGHRFHLSNTAAPDCIMIDFDLTKDDPKGCLKQIATRFAYAKEKAILFLAICNREGSAPNCLFPELRSTIACTFFPAIIDKTVPITTSLSNEITPGNIHRIS